MLLQNVLPTGLPYFVDHIYLKKLKANKVHSNNRVRLLCVYLRKISAGVPFNEKEMALKRYGLGLKGLK